MTQPPEFPIRPIRPEAITAWVASLSSEEVLKLAQSVASGDLGRVLGDPFARPELDPVVLADPPVETPLLTVHLSLDDTEPLVWRRLSIPGDLDTSLRGTTCSRPPWAGPARTFTALSWVIPGADHTS